MRISLAVVFCKSIVTWLAAGLVLLRTGIPQKKWSSHHGQQKSLKRSTWMKSQKQQNVRFQGKPFNITVIQVYAPTSNAEEAEVERFYEDLQDLLVHIMCVRGLF